MRATAEEIQNLLNRGTMPKPQERNVGLERNLPDDEIAIRLWEQGRKHVHPIEIHCGNKADAVIETMAPLRNATVIKKVFRHQPNRDRQSPVSQQSSREIVASGMDCGCY